MSPPSLPGRGLKPPKEIRLVWVVGGNPRGEDGQHGKAEDQEGRGDGESIPGELAEIVAENRTASFGRGDGYGRRRAHSSTRGLSAV